jgi:RecA-family ATPase
VLDTVARTFGDGDENATQDMNAYVGAIDHIREATGAHVALIHHGTKDGAMSRGSGALVAAADLVVKVEKHAGGNHAKVQCAKDDAEGDVLPFRLRSIQLPAERDGSARITCIAEECDAVPIRRSAGRLAEATQQALRLLKQTIGQSGDRRLQTAHVPDHVIAVEESVWREACYRSSVSNTSSHGS